MRRLIRAVVCCAALVVPLSSAHAELVISDSGTTGAFSLNSVGGGGVGQMVSIQFDLANTAQLLTINGNTVGPYTAAFPDALNLTITGATTIAGTTIFDFSQTGTFRKQFDFGGGDMAELLITITTGLASDLLPQNIIFGGSAILVTNSTLYDFSNFAGGGTNSFSLDATALDPPGSFRNIVLNGGTALGSGSFAELASAAPVPAPSGIFLGCAGGLLGLGATWRARRVKKVVA